MHVISGNSESTGHESGHDAGLNLGHDYYFESGDESSGGTRLC